MSEKKQANRLAGEKSPYLLQHAFNPVDWYPWGEAAFSKARSENKMIFLSIGYSTCHWCHVMERESFENEEVAALLNRDFVAVKVDREERPDIDHVYMTAVQAISGSGGWPLSVFLTPDAEPVTGGTYFPPEDRWGKPGMKTLLPRLAQAWREQGEEMKAAGRQISGFLTPAEASAGKSGDWPSVFQKAYTHFETHFDENYGGFGGAPKFPRSHELLFLLRYWKQNGETHALEMVQKTLDSMAFGGIYDHLGGGFHRYATDEVWLVPHFEKMLYDQAMIARTYLEAYQACGKEFYARVACDIFRYVLRDMKSPEGGFYSAEDADSEGEEGKFYVWRPEEIDQVLGVMAGKVFRDFYQVTDEGNFEHSTSILHQVESLEAFAAGHGIEPDALEKLLRFSREKLFEHRKKRIPPHKDDKILTAWNGLMISALAFGARVLEEPAYAEAASKAADFILTRMMPEKRLLRRSREGESAIPAFQEDYACLALGLLDLYETGFEKKRLDQAELVLSEMIRLFGDPESGGFYYTGSDAETLIARLKEYYDGAVPSGNSIAVSALQRFSCVSENPFFEDAGKRALESNKAAASAHPAAFPYLLSSAFAEVYGPREVRIKGKKESPEIQAMLRAARRYFHPAQTVLFCSSNEEPPSASICSGRVCRKPVFAAEELQKELERHEDKI